MNRNIAIVAIVGAALAGCSSMNLQGDAAADEPIYTTGSHLPSRSTNSNSVTVLQAPAPDQGARGVPCVGGTACGSGK